MASGRSQYIPLRLRSPYSILEGATKISDLVSRCSQLKIPAAGITDTNNMCAALEFSESMCAAGVQPILGCTLTLDLQLDGDALRQTARTNFDGKVALLAQDETGYRNLMHLSSAAFLEPGAMEMPHIKLAALLKHHEGLILLSGGNEGFLNQLAAHGRMQTAENVIEQISETFEGRTYIEIQRHDWRDPERKLKQRQTESALLNLAYDMRLPIVATNEPYFLDAQTHKAHDALLAISEGSYVLEPDRRHVSPSQYFQKPEEMDWRFEDLPEAIETTREIAARCAFRSPKRKPILPSFGEGGESEAEILARQAHEGLKKRLEQVTPVADASVYEVRLDFELSVIGKMGFPGYFLIVADFIQWAKDHDIPVGPGRGSGAASVCAWALTITDLDPLRYGLLFERFLNPERISMPDFDIDFCQDRRGEVIRYVQQKYGDEQVAHIITFGTLQARAVVRDVGRVQQVPLGQVDRLAKLVPSNPANPVTLTEAVKLEPALRAARDEEPAVRELLDTAVQLEGLYRNASTHAAGVVIGDRPLTQLVPLYRDPRSDIPATQFTMKWAEKAGLVKFDFLGLKTLTVIDRARKYLRAQGTELDIDGVDTADKDAYAPLAQGHSLGVFQLESTGMRDVLRKMAPDSIEELTALISLYRPGPMKNIDNYVDRKFGREEIDYHHPSLENILKETYGIIIYQEQVMQIAQVLSGYSLGEADILRRAMGKKDKAEMARQKSRFIDGAAKNGVKETLSEQIFDLVNEFAGYGFNKAHAAAYALISFQTAYLKAHHPVEFMAASMSLDLANSDKLALFAAETVRMDIEIVPPCVNESEADFAVKDGKLLYALGAIKNVGLDAMTHLISERAAGGPFKHLYDFARRVDSRAINRRAFENLARAGAFDALEPSRAKVLAASDILISIAQRSAEERSSSQVSLFGDNIETMEEKILPSAKNWGEIEQLGHELSAIGFYLSGHPLASYFTSQSGQGKVQNSGLGAAYNNGQRVVKMAGVLHRKQERISQRTRKKFAYLSMSDPSGEYEVFIGEDMLGHAREFLTAGNLIVLQVKIDDRDGELRLTANKLSPMPIAENGAISAAQPQANGNASAKGSNNGAPKRTVAWHAHYDGEPSTLRALKDCLENLKDAPARHKGQIILIAPENANGRQLYARLAGQYSMDKPFGAALKAIDGITRVEAH